MGRGKCEDPAVDDALQHRIAANESTFRDVNEAIEAGRWPGERHGRVAFRCECAKLGCNLMIELTTDEYERIRGNSRWFLVAFDHHVPDAETVVETRGNYVVVEKRGEAGRLAEEADPRQ
jgi:hypothetical protein